MAGIDSKIVKAILPAVAAALLLVVDYGDALDLREAGGLGARFWIDYHYEGLGGAAATVRGLDVDHVHALEYRDHPRIHQRLVELLYPIEVTHVAPEELEPGDLAVIPVGVRLDLPAEVLHRCASVRVLRVRR